MYNKYSKTIIKASEWDRVYIVKYIIKSLNKFTLIFIIYTSHSEIIFSAAASDTSLHNNIIDFLKINTALLNEKIKTYRL